MRIEVVTLFPELVAGGLKFGVLGRALERRLLTVGTEDPRSYATDVHRTVDDRPYGGGPGMVLKPGPMLAAIQAAHARLPAAVCGSRYRRRASGSPSSACANLRRCREWC
jgi:tRNA (guanine37-N1)-methyltransferase